MRKPGQWQRFLPVSRLGSAYRCVELPDASQPLQRNDFRYHITFHDAAQGLNLPVPYEGHALAGKVNQLGDTSWSLTAIRGLNVDTLLRIIE
jgi:hypothetical protein